SRAGSLCPSKIRRRLTSTRAYDSMASLSARGVQQRAPSHAVRTRGALPRAMALVLACVVAGCATSRAPAPVEERTPVGRPAPTLNTPPTPSAAASGPLPASAASVPGATDATKPGIENAGKPGYYTIKPGDTLIRVGLETGQNARDIARWNNI